MLTKEEILKAFGNKGYEITTDHTCDCRIEGMSNNGIVIEQGNECWYARALYIGGELIAEYIQHNGITMHTQEIGECDICANDDVYSELQIDDREENPAHDTERLMIEYFEGCPEAKFYRNNLRGFATIIIDLKGDNTEDIRDDWDTLTAGEAAREIAYNGADIWEIADK